MHRNGRHTEWSEKNEDWTEKNISSNSSKEEINVHTGLGYTICYMLYLDGLTPFPYTFFTSSFSSSSFSIYQTKKENSSIVKMLDLRSSLFSNVTPHYFVVVVEYRASFFLQILPWQNIIFLDLYSLTSEFCILVMLEWRCCHYHVMYIIFLAFFISLSTSQRSIQK